MSEQEESVNNAGTTKKIMYIVIAAIVIIALISIGFIVYRKNSKTVEATSGLTSKSASNVVPTVGIYPSYKDASDSINVSEAKEKKDDKGKDEDKDDNSKPQKKEKLLSSRLVSASSY